MISIVMPLFNKEQWVSECIASILNQSYADFELIIINDGSTDNSVEAVKPFLNDTRITLVHQENAGVSAARNAGILKAKHGYIAFIDADDLWHPDYLSICKDVIQQNGDVAIFGSAYQLKKDDLHVPSWPKIEKTTYTRINNYFRNADKDALFWTSTTIVKKSELDEVGLFNEQLKTGEDLDLWFRILMKHKGIRINNVLAFYRLTTDDQGSVFKLPPINRHLVSIILSEHYPYRENFGSVPFLREFVYRYTLNYLFLYYFVSNQYKEAWAIYKSVPLRYRLSRARYLLYGLPRKVGRRIFLYVFTKRNKYNVDQEKLNRELHNAPVP